MIEAQTHSQPTLSVRLRSHVDTMLEAADVAREIRNPKVLLTLLPSAARGFITRRAKQEGRADMKSGHSAHFDFTYGSDYPDMFELYRRAKLNQWNAETDVDWSVDVDPMNPEVPIVPDWFFQPEALDPYGIKLTDKEVQRFKADVASWILSQFLHGEQGALLAAAQVTEAVPWTDGKFYGSTQVVDEGRHVEVFHRYLSTKLNKLYQINDNLFVIIDALMTDSRWDVKFLGMQIMVEGLALGAFSQIYCFTREPLLKKIVQYVIQDEARHVHYGVLALKEAIAGLSERERNEREDWAFQVALLMRNRFLMHEIYEEWFEGRLARRNWNRITLTSPGLLKFRTIMFSRLVPNLKFIGLLSPRMEKRYAEVGLLQYAGGKNASELTARDLLGDLDREQPPAN